MKDVITIKLDPSMRIFVKGVEITELCKDGELKTETTTFERLQKTVPIDHIMLTVTLNLGSNSRIEFDPHILYIIDYPTDEFLAEMVRIKLRREGILDDNRNENDNS